MNKKATIANVAELAGVSIATVSYVLNGRENKKISGETVERVREAAKALNYISSSAARELLTGKSRCVGIVANIPFTLPRHALVLQGIRDVLEKNKYGMFLCTSNIEENGRPNYLNAFFSKRVDGIIYLSASSDTFPKDEEHLIQRERIPFVSYNCEFNKNISSVDIDYYTGAFEAMMYLAEKGVKKIFYLQPWVNDRQERDREQGVWRASYEMDDIDVTILKVENDGLSSIETPEAEIRDSNLIHVFNSFFNSSGRKALNDIDSTSGLVCSWSTMDQSALSFTLSRGLNIPVVVLTQGSLSNEVFPNIHYSFLPSHHIGTECADSIIDLIDNPSAITHKLLKPHLRDFNVETETISTHSDYTLI